MQVKPDRSSVTLVVFGMRLIRRPWKGCRFWDVPFTIPWKGCKFQKWGFPKWGYRIWNFRFFNVLHMEGAYVAYVVVWSSGGVGRVGGGVGMLTFVSSASITLRKRHMLHMLSYDRQGGGGVGWRGALASTSRSAKASSPMTALFYTQRVAGQCCVYRVTLYTSWALKGAYKCAQCSCMYLCRSVGVRSKQKHRHKFKSNE